MVRVKDSLEAGAGLITFDDWKEDPSGEHRLSSVPLLSALVYGRIIIGSAQGNKVKIDGAPGRERGGLLLMQLAWFSTLK